MPRRQIHFQHFNYPVFNNETSSTCARPAPHKTIKNFVKRDYTASVSNIPYPEESTVNLRQFLVMKGARRVPSAFETMVKKLESVQFHVKELAKQRERMMAVIQRVSSKDASACYTKVERFEKELPTCCRGVREDDFKVIIEKTTAVLQSSTMEANLVSIELRPTSFDRLLYDTESLYFQYRGMMQMIGNKCDTFDSYASMTTRVMLKELEECIDDVMTLLNEFIGAHQSLARFQDFRKLFELFAAVVSVVTLIRSDRIPDSLF